MSNPAPTLNQINAFNATQGTTIDFNIIGGTELVRSNRIYIYDLSDNSLICTHLYVSTESIHELPANTDSSIVYESGKSSADFVNGAQYYAQIQTYIDTAGTEGGSGLSVAKMFWCLVDPTLTITTILSTISTTSYNVSATYNANTSIVSNIIQQYQFNLYSATGSLLQSSGVVVGNGEQQGTSDVYDISYNFTGLSVGSSYYVTVEVTTTQGMSVSAQSNTFTVSIDTPTLGEATVVNNACDGYISVTSNLSGEYGGSVSGEIASFVTDSINNISSLKVSLDPIQDLHGYDAPWVGGAGKNKLPQYSKGQTVNGIVWTVNEDGSLTAKGTATERSIFYYLPNNDYGHISGSIKATMLDKNGDVIPASTASVNSGIKIGNNWGGFNSATMVVDGVLSQVWFSIDKLNTAVDYTIYPIVYDASLSPTPWQPYSNICPITAPTTSKNLLPYPYADTRTSIAGVEIANNGDGTLTLNGTTDATLYYNLGSTGINEILLPAGAYIASIEGVPNNNNIRLVVVKNGAWFANTNSGVANFILTESANIYCYLIATNGITFENLTIKPQLEVDTSGVGYSTPTAYQPYGENIQVNRQGKNLLRPIPRSGSQSGISYTIHDDGRITINGTANGIVYLNYDWVNNTNHPNDITKYIGKTMYASITPSLGSRATFDGTVYTKTGGVRTLASNIGDGRTINVIDGDAWGRFYIAIYENSTFDNETFYPIMCYDSETDKTWEPYQEQSYVTYTEVQVFGGTLDLVSGMLTVTHKMVVPSLGGFSPESSSYSNINYLRIYKPTDSKNTGNTGVHNLLTNMYEAEVGRNWDSADNIGKFLTGATYTWFWIGFPKSTTEQEAKDVVNGLQLCYELATPLTYQLTPQEIRTLVGTNNVWSEDGEVEITYNIPITNLLVKRQDVADVSGTWLTLYSQPVTQASDMDFTFIDFLNQYGKTYKYALVPLLTQTQSGVEVEVEGGYTVSDEVQSIFDGVFIADQTGLQKCKANVGYGDVDMNQAVGTITPIGAKYPVVITNSKNQYHNGSITGTIVPDDYYSNGNLSRIDMVNKRNELGQFLTNKRAKIIKDWNSNIWLVMIMDNVNCTFNNEYGMGIVNFTANWIEVGDPTNQQDLQATGLIDVGGV